MNNSDIKFLIRETLELILQEDNSKPLQENVLLTEDKVSKNLQYHLDKGIPLHENAFRYGTEAQLKLFKEVRKLYNEEKLYLNPEDRWLVENTDIGNYGIYEDQFVALDVPFIEEEQLNEAKYQGKEVSLNKPKRGGSKKFYVYVKDPKTKKIKKVSFGAAGGGQNLAVKIRDPKARRAFASRQNCDKKKDRTTPGYWSCNIGRYWKSLGGGSNFSGYW
jgi:hypothetical protein